MLNCWFELTEDIHEYDVEEGNTKGEIEQRYSDDGNSPSPLDDSGWDARDLMSDGSDSDVGHSQVEGEHTTSSSICHVIDVEPSEWSNIRPICRGRREVLNSEWRDYLLSVFDNKCNCVIAFGNSHVSPLSSRKRNIPYIRQHAYCTFKSCCNFLVSVHKNQNFTKTVRLEIVITGNENHGRQPRKFRRTCSKEAEEIAKKLKCERPTDVYERLINESPIDKLLAGNYNVPKSPAVVRRLNSLTKKCERLHKDVCIELDMLHNLYSDSDGNKCLKGFIQRRGSNPFFVSMYSKEQIDLLHKQGTVILYLDATGSLFRKWKGFEKRMLLYSLILPNLHVGEPCIPIMEMIANDHTTEMVSHMLFSLRLDLNRLHKQLGLAPFPAQLVVTDFSWPLIHSVFHSLNDGMTMEIFLTQTYDSLIANKEWSKSSTGIFICANHVVHIVVKKVKSMSKQVSADCKNAFIHSFILLQYTLNNEDAIETIKLISTVFGTSRMSKDVKKATKMLHSKIRHWKISKRHDINEIVDSNQMNQKPNDDDRQIKKGSKYIRKSSPWLAYFESILQGVSKHLARDGVVQAEGNPYFSADLMKYLLEHWLSLFPIWCTAASKLYDIVDKQSWYSNCHVENWFASVKASHLRQSSIGARVSVTKFIQKQREIIMQRLRRFQLSESRDAPSRKKKSDKTTMHDSQEKWGLGRKKRARYVKPQPKLVNNLFKNITSLSASSSEQDSDSSDSSGATECYICDDFKNDSNDSLPDIDSPIQDFLTTGPNINTKRSLSKVSTFKPKTHDEGNTFEFMTRTGYHITSQDKLSLNGNEWLQLNVVTAYLECIETPECITWSDGAWSLIEKGKCIGSVQDAIQKTDWSTVHKIIIGRGEPAHFVLIIIDLINYNLSCFDTLGGSSERGSQYVTKWNKFATMHLNTILNGQTTFSYQHLDHPMQQDSSSCGVLVCMLGYSIVTGTPSADVDASAVNIRKYRQEIRRTLLDDIDTERYCRKHDEPIETKKGPIDNWLMCDNCRNWFHFGCARNLAQVTVEEMELTSWTCHLCTLYNS